MFKTIILPAVMAIALTAGGAAFAATPTPVATKATPAVVTKAAPVAVKSGLTHEQVKEIRKACRAENKGNKAAYKTCVHAKAKEAAAAGK